MMQWAEIHGGGIRHQFRPGPGPTVVLLHEMGGSLESWEGVLAALPKDWQVLRYDMRGAGLSDKLAAPCTIDQHVGDLAGLLDHLSLHAPFTLAGIAVGAGIGIRFARLHPQRVAGLLALAPALGVAAAAREATHALGQQIIDLGTRAAATGLLDRAVPEELRTDPQAWTEYRLRWLASDGRSLGLILQMLAGMNLDQDLQALTVPTALIGGSFDALRPPAEIDRLAALLPTAHKLVLPTGHMMATHSPGLLAALLRAAVQDLAHVAQASQDFLAAPQSWRGANVHAA